MPSSPGPAFIRGQRSGDPVSMYLEDVYTVGVNLAGLPGVTVPGGFAHEGDRALPVGMQLVGPALGEAKLLRIARMLEQATRFGERVPPLAE
jgi:aspartyl-tRNA(Asn)/glutamyl-tRNA(Gln) amidotransferase subunit A